MDTLFNLEMNNEIIRFTPDGRISIVDAIRTLSGQDDSVALWDSLTATKPEILEHCESYPSDNNEELFVADTNAWDEIVMLLADHLLGRENAQASGV